MEGLRTVNHDNALCSNCGACCRDAVHVESGEGVPLEHTVEIGGRRWMRPHEVAPWCGALDLVTWRCTIYEQRPRVCREFEVAGRGCDIARQRSDGLRIKVVD